MSSSELELELHLPKTSRSQKKSKESSHQLSDDRNSATSLKRVITPYQINTNSAPDLPISTTKPETPLIKKFRKTSLGRRRTILDFQHSIEDHNNGAHTELDSGLIGILRQLSRQLVIEFQEEDKNRPLYSSYGSKNERRKSSERSKKPQKKQSNTLQHRTLEQQYLQKLALSGKESDSNEVEFFIDDFKKRKEVLAQEDLETHPKGMDSKKKTRGDSGVNIQNTSYDSRLESKHLGLSNSPIFQHNSEINNDTNGRRLSQTNSNLVIKMNTTPPREGGRPRSSFGRSDREIETVREAQDRLSLTDRRLSEIFPEFNTTQIEDDDGSFERSHEDFKDDITHLSEYVPKPVKSRKLSLNEPFKIEINNLDIPNDSSQLSLELEEEESEILDKDEIKESSSGSFVIQVDEPQIDLAAVRLDEEAYKKETSSFMGEDILTSFQSNVPQVPDSLEKTYSSGEEIIDGSKVELKVRDVNDTDDDDNNSVGGFDLYEGSDGLVDQNEEKVKENIPLNANEPFPEYTLEDEEIYRRQVDFDQERLGNTQSPSVAASDSFVFQKPVLGNKLDKRAPPTVSKAMLKDFASSFVLSRRKVSPDALDALVDIQELFFGQMGSDLAAYSRHASRKRIDVDDVLALMKRQRVLSSASRNGGTSDSGNRLHEPVPVDLIAQQFFPQELVDDLVEAVADKDSKKTNI